MAPRRGVCPCIDLFPSFNRTCDLAAAMRKSLPVAARCFRLQELHRVARVRHLHRSPFSQRTTTALCKSSNPNQNSIRFASTSQAAVAEAGSIANRLKNLLLVSSLGLFAWFGYLYVTDVRAGIHQWAVAPSLRWIYDDAEEAHEAGTESLKTLYAWGLHPRERDDRDKKGDLSVEVMHGLLMSEFYSDSPNSLLGIWSHAFESNWDLCWYR